MVKVKSIEKALEIVIDLIFFEYTKIIDIKDIKSIEFINDRDGGFLDIQTTQRKKYFFIKIGGIVATILDGYKKG